MKHHISSQKTERRLIRAEMKRLDRRFDKLSFESKKMLSNMNRLLKRKELLKQKLR